MKINLCRKCSALGKQAVLDSALIFPQMMICQQEFRVQGGDYLRVFS